MKNRAVILLSVVAALMVGQRVAATTTQCDYYPLTTCGQTILGHKSFPDGIDVPGGVVIDGGFVNLTTNQIVAGEKSWIADASFANIVLVGDGGRSTWDGGVFQYPPGRFIGPDYTAVAQFHGLLYDAGYWVNGPPYGQWAVGSFDCSGVGGDGTGNGQPCLTNSQGIVEIYGHTMGTAQEALGQGEGLCPVEIYDMNNDTFPDGGQNVGMSFCLGHNGAGDKYFRFDRQSNMLFDGPNIELRNFSRAAIAATGANTGLELFGNNQTHGPGFASVYVQPIWGGTLPLDEDLEWGSGGVEYGALNPYGAITSYAPNPIDNTWPQAAYRSGGQAPHTYATGVAFENLGGNSIDPCNSYTRSSKQFVTTSLADGGGGSINWWYECDGSTWKPEATSNQTRPLQSGSITLSTGTGTATVVAGAICVCDDSTAAAVVKCAVSSTTLTATGIGSDVVSYICL